MGDLLRHKMLGIVGYISGVKDINGFLYANMEWLNGAIGCVPICDLVPHSDSDPVSMLAELADTPSFPKITITSKREI